MPTLADYPHLVAQLDRKNGAIDPATIALGSRRKLWWRCPEGPDHVWEAKVSNRAMCNTGCPFCAGRRVSVTNALSRMAPAVARQWHPTRNGDLRPRDAAIGASRAIWWKCPMGSDHVWRASIANRIRGHGCPFCTGKRPSARRNFAFASPHLVAEWHPTRNGDLRPEDVTPRSNRTIWWKCAQGHEWSAAPSTRAAGSGCPFCAGKLVTRATSLAARDPAVAKQWHPTKNGTLRPRDVTLGSARVVWWKCPKGPDHEWQAEVAQRQHFGCPFCSSRRVSVTNSLAHVSPALADQWHPTKNGDLGPGDVTNASRRRVWWQCPHNPAHAWQATVHLRRPDRGCPFCSGRLASPETSLATLDPRLASEWHPTKNGELTPHDVTRGTHRRAWWRCQLGHAWQTTVNVRTSKGSGCPECYRLRRTTTAAKKSTG